MTLGAHVSSPPSELISRVSVNYVSSALSLDSFSDALVKYANPQIKIMTAVVVERVSSLSVVSRSFVAYSVVLRPDVYGTNTTLIIKGASYDDTVVKAGIIFQLDTLQPLNVQLTTFAASQGYICTFDVGVATAPPVSGRLFQPSTLPKILDEVCLQNKIIPHIDQKNKMIHFYAQDKAPILAAVSLGNTFSFLGYGSSALMWGVGVENFANVKFKTSIFDAALFDKITIYNDSQSALFEGFVKALPGFGPIPAVYEAYIIRYTIERNDLELCCEVTATNNWLLAQTRIDGILESKIYGALL